MVWAALAGNPGVVGDDAALGIADRLVALEGDFAGDGLDDTDNGGAEGSVVSGGFLGCLLDVVGADLVDEAAGAVCGAGLFDEDLGGVEGNGLHGAVLEVDEARPEE